MRYPLSITHLIDNCMRLPGIGERTTMRLAFYIMDTPEDDVEGFFKSLVQVKRNLHSCSIYGSIIESDPCEAYRDTSRGRSTAMVVERPKDAVAFEEMGEYSGLYHVLYGVLSPMDGVGPEEINIKSLITRLQKQSEAKKIILALNSSPEGETTAMYLAKLTKPAGLKVMRLAARLAVGSDIEYTNSITLRRTVQRRTDL